VLARLLEEPGVETAESDVRGELMRVRLTDGANLDHALRLLERLGFAAALAEGGVGDGSWYGVDRVGELSQAEGRIIAERVIPPFARDHGLDEGTATKLIQTVARALFECFIDRELTGTASAVAFRSDCRAAVVRVAAPIVGGDLAATLGEAVERDLAERSTGGNAADEPRPS